MEQQKNFLATEPVGKLFRRLALPAVVAIIIMPAVLYHPRYDCDTV